MFLSSIYVLLFLLTAIDATPIWRRVSTISPFIIVDAEDSCFQANTFTVPTLPYDAGALAPHISAGKSPQHVTSRLAADESLTTLSNEQRPSRDLDWCRCGSQRTEPSSHRRCCKGGSRGRNRRFHIDVEDFGRSSKVSLRSFAIEPLLIIWF